RRGRAHARVRDQAAQPVHATRRPAVHPTGDGDVAARHALGVRRPAGRPAGIRPLDLDCGGMFVFKAAVVGAGTMGGEIAHAIANAEIPVVLKDVDQRFVEQGMEKAHSLWQGRVDAGKLSAEELERKLGLITGTTAYDGFGDVDFVIEAVPERMDVKQAVFSELDEVTPGHAILSSNTSSLSITEMGEATRRPDKVVGFHFFYPASMMRLIEVIEGDDTSPETAQAAASFAQAIRKMPIRCGEAPGFVVNRILNSSVSELWRYQEE